VKRNLDRKDKVQQIRAQVDEVIKRSIVEVMSRSPIRGGTQVQKIPNNFHYDQQ
jgi:hypothetical protein